MKIEVEKGVTITLTDAQLKEINEQRKRKRFTIQDLKGNKAYEIALKVLGWEDEETDASCDTSAHKLETIIKAANYIDNGYKEWKADFNDNNTEKYIPYAEKTSSSWVFIFVAYYCRFSVCPVGFYYMKESTAKTVFMNNISLYNEWLG